MPTRGDNGLAFKKSAGLLSRERRCEKKEIGGRGEAARPGGGAGRTSSVELLLRHFTVNACSHWVYHCTTRQKGVPLGACLGQGPGFYTPSWPSRPPCSLLSRLLPAGALQAAPPKGRPALFFEPMHLR